MPRRPRKRAKPQSALAGFAERHLIKVTGLLREETVAIESISIAFNALNMGYTELDYTAYSDPSIGFLFNMLHRNYEHVEAAVVSCVTGSGAAAESIARAAFETSVNIMYILIGDRVKRLRAYFEHYFRETNRQVTQWETRTKDLPLSDREIHSDAILRRRGATDSLQKLAQTLFGPPQEAWPNTSQRFEAIGFGIEYRTLYSRMSAEIHADAEETLRYFVGRTSADPALFEAMSLETIMFTRFLIYYAITVFIRACGGYAIAFSLPETLPKMTEAFERANAKLLDIAPHTGAGL